jgi:hypothetical protein
VSEDQEKRAREMAQELRNLRVEDVLVNTLVAVSSIGYQRLGATPDTVEDRDLAQVRLAIDTMQALTTVLETFVPDELLRDFTAAVASLQLAYVQAASEDAAAAETETEPEAEDTSAAEPDDA